MQLEELLGMQRSFFKTHQTLDIKLRKASLRNLRDTIRKREADIMDALYQDLHKSKTESYMSELGLVLSELTYQLRHIDAWSTKQNQKTPLTQFYAKSYQIWEPYGTVLIMAPWNYPFQLCMEPLIGALAAGNTAIIKPSAYAPHTSHIISELIKECFPPQYVSVVEGGRAENNALLKHRFDYIFFTGSVEVGKQVMCQASRFLTPVSLELGGKSPCIVAGDADIKLAAKRIAFGKFLNAGQTCVAPDYVLVDRSVRNELLVYLRQAIELFFGKHPIDHPDYPRIINEKHFDRLRNLMCDECISTGGKCRRETLQIEPTILNYVELEDAIMQEEIFGPLLPVIAYDDIDEVVTYLNEREKPLALYVFTRSKHLANRMVKEVSFGGGCINDTIIHLANSTLGFGGVGQSGMGSYHGYDSFTTFSHKKSIVHKANWIDLPMRYHPYTKSKDKLIRMFMK